MENSANLLEAVDDSKAGVDFCLNSDAIPVVTSLLFLELSKAGHDDDDKVLLRTNKEDTHERPLAN